MIPDFVRNLLNVFRPAVDLPDKFRIIPTATEMEFVSDEPLELENMRCPGIIIQLQVVPIRNSTPVSDTHRQYTTLMKVNGGQCYVWNKSEDKVKHKHSQYPK